MGEDKLNVVIVGTGYVGLTTGVCLAYLGHRVVCCDANPQIVERLRGGQATIHEPGIQCLMKSSSRLRFQQSLVDALPGADVVIIAVGTPSKTNGDADTSAVEKVAAEIGNNLTEDMRPVIVNKSTVPIGSCGRIKTVVAACLAKRKVRCDFSVASNPEFLREGVAVIDTLYPDRIVIGTDAPRAADVLSRLYRTILDQTFAPPPDLLAPADCAKPHLLATTTTSAELIKYAANAFLAVKISYINEIAGLAEKVGADINEVAQGIGLDKRIGTQYLKAGLGWGGSCFGKDTKAIAYTAAQYGQPMDIVKAAVQANYRQRLIVVEKLQAVLKVVRGRTIGLLGLAFKPDTDDLRDAPSIDIIDKLLDLGAHIRVYDPVAMANTQKVYPQLAVEYCGSVEELCVGSDALVLVTEWPVFRQQDWPGIASRMRSPVIIDGRNLLDRPTMEAAGFTYQGVGR